MPTPANSNLPEIALASSAFAPDTCTDLSICRTQYTVVWSSLVTILACVWTAVHRNVPAPEWDGESRFSRIVGRAWEAAKIVVVTVLAPEWVLAWAVRQLLNARAVKRELEWTRGVRKQAIPQWMAPKLRAQLETTRRRAAMKDSGKEGGNREENAAAQPAVKDGSGDQPMKVQLEFDMMSVNKQNGRLSTEWTTRHGFSVIMGGFHYYKDGQPQSPMSRDDVVVLVYSGNLVLPTDEEIRNWSHSDVLSKALAIIQTLWFVVQAIARRMEGLPITQLEIMTLAYTTITVAMYVAWWDKPQNVGGPVRVAVKELPRLASAWKREWYLRIFDIIAGWQDSHVNLRKERRVPLFYGGSTGDVGDNSSFLADVLALLAAVVFGAVHCAAWHYAFPSYAETMIWRISSLAIVALPAAMLVPVLVMLLWYTSTPDSLDRILFPVMFALCAPLYIAARLLLLALSFSTLRSLPPEAYHAVQWTLLIPHFT
ncbi:hypothetical protein BV25DRAFT_1918210 [Artomyces pyxidatus]|uniref:Uncharacterized protein n=1 Tax=Artomyces pyxidatus TaxID=48021 RepID=A0ACB8SVJ0_9AGAM|nr:hypothetical protein BV25DRAFT_1918210 [Artomyces pyxidatus]